jgi:hypothetical protein
MKFALNICIFLLLCFFAACREKAGLYIIKYEETGFRKSFAGEEYMTEQEQAAVQAGNPLNDNVEDSALYSSLRKQGLINERDELVLSSFQFEKSPTVTLLNSKGDSVRCAVELRDKENWRYVVAATSKNENYELPLSEEEMTFDKVNYFVADVFAGGFKEIVVIRTHYISGGESYDVIVFEVKKD